MDQRGQEQERLRYSSRTILEMGNEDNETKTLASLGRSFKLGMLYDCRTDSIIPGVTLWNLETLRANRDVTPKPNTVFQVIVSDSIDDKSSALNVSGDLKASLMGGMIEVEGSGKYLDDKKKSQKHARVTLQYSTTTRFEQLTMSHLAEQNISYPEVFEQGMATHVVTALLFGAHAFFVFDREVSSSENLSDIQGHMQAKINNIPKFGIVGDVSLELSNEDKDNVQMFGCTFYGDYSLQSNPTSFLDAIDIYKSLPQGLGENGEHAVPMKVWLYPLKKLNARAAQLVRCIGVNLISRSQAILEFLDEVDMRCSDMIKECPNVPFPVIKLNLQRFRARCLQHRHAFQKRLASALPTIRGGGEEEGILADILINTEQSPLGSQLLTEWLDNKHLEMSLVAACLNKMKGINLAKSQVELETQIFDLNTQYLVCFTFTSLDQEDTYLSQMDNYLRSQSPGKAYQPTSANPGQKSCHHLLHEMRKCAQSFLEFYAANRADANTSFLIASVLDQNHTGASIYLYEDATLVSSCFKPPVKPVTPSVFSRSHDSVSLNLQPADQNGQIMGFRVEFRTAKQETWDIQTTSGISNPCTITGLSPYKEYQLQYRTVSNPWVSLASDSLRVTTLPTNAPGKLSMAQVEGFDVKVTWEKPSVVGDGVTIHHYKIQYQVSRNTSSAEGDPWQETTTKDSKCFYILRGLIPSATYTLLVSAVCGQAGESPLSHEASLKIESKEKKEASKTTTYAPKKTNTEQNPKLLAGRYVMESKLLTKGDPAIYQLLVKRLRCENNGDPVKYRFGKESPIHNVKTIMVLGATGSGKTTLINAMVNYILGVEWEDKFRYKLIHEETNRSQAESQTSSISAYELSHQEGYRVCYSLNIIDTPGYGDTQGITRDKNITNQIREFFTSPHGVDQIDVVCFVVQASLARLTRTQKYIFDSILSIFGKDIAENIRVLVTFADGQVPPVLEAVNESEIPCPKDNKGQPLHFKFNNSAIFAESGTLGKCGSDEENFDKMFWRMNSSSMRNFFSSLSTIKSKSLRLTKEVLKERNQLDVTVEGLQPQINVGLCKLEEIRKTKQVLNQHKAEVKANENFEYEIKVTKAVKKDISSTRDYITNCQQCHITCHHPCFITNDGDKHECAAMDESGYCMVCPGKCIWSVHHNQHYKFEYVETIEKRTYKNLKEKYEKSSGEMMTQEKIMQKLEEDLFLIQKKVLRLVETLSHCLTRLKEIALRPNPLSTLEYIDWLIEGEKQEVKPGYQDRIQSLSQVKKQAELLTKVTSNQDLLPDKSKQHNHQLWA